MATGIDTAALPGEIDSRGPRPRMWRAAWRQHRWWVIGTLAVAVVGALTVVLTAVITPACASTAWWEQPGGTCDQEAGRVLWRLYRGGLQILPIVAGALLGAITFGPDAEHRTQVYALTQSVRRLRWWAVKVAVTAGPVFLAVAILGCVNLWAVPHFNEAFVPLTRVSSPGFDMLGLIPASRFLIAYAVAAAAAAVWRTIGGAVAGLAVAGLITVCTPLLQPLVVPHERDLIPIETWLADDTGWIGGGIDTAYNWGSYADADGREVDTRNLDCRQLDQSRLGDCLVENGVPYRLETYVADAQFLQMTIILTGMNLLIAGAFLALGGRRMTRRDL